jgi:ketosteroid isomerase-like protein
MIMKKSLKTFYGIFLALAMLTGITQAQDTQAEPPRSEPLRSVRQLFAAMNAGDFEAARALFAEDGYSAYGMDGSPHVGEGLDAWLQSDIFGANAQFEVQNECVEGNTVVADGRWGANGDLTRSFRYLFSVRDGLIQAWNIIDPAGENPCETNS